VVGNSLVSTEKHLSKPLARVIKTSRAPGKLHLRTSTIKREKSAKRKNKQKVARTRPSSPEEQGSKTTKRPLRKPQTRLGKGRQLG